jgi:lipoprotein-anchoring transpeptidase ErfK/SrfK
MKTLPTSIGRPSKGRQFPRTVILLFIFAGILSGALPAAAIPTTPALVANSTVAANPISQKMASLKKSRQRWIEVNLSSQRLIAWEGKKPVHAVIVSTGKASTPTVTGVFEIQEKHRSLTLEGADYVVPDVPFTMFFWEGYAIHGAYWHHNFGTPVSHGCVNVAPDHAEWIFNWATVGTPVIVHD